MKKKIYSVRNNCFVRQQLFLTNKEEDNLDFSSIENNYRMVANVCGKAICNIPILKNIIVHACYFFVSENARADCAKRYGHSILERKRWIHNTFALTISSLLRQ